MAASPVKKNRSANGPKRTARRDHQRIRTEQTKQTEVKKEQRKQTQFIATIFKHSQYKKTHRFSNRSRNNNGRSTNRTNRKRRPFGRNIKLDKTLERISPTWRIQNIERSVEKI